MTFWRGAALIGSGLSFGAAVYIIFEHTGLDAILIGQSVGIGVLLFGLAMIWPRSN